MDGIGGLGNDTVLQLWAEAREDWNDTVAQVGWCTAARSMWRHWRKYNSGALWHASSQLRRLLQQATASYSHSRGEPRHLTSQLPIHIKHLTSHPYQGISKTSTSQRHGSSSTRQTPPLASPTRCCSAAFSEAKPACTCPTPKLQTLFR